MADTAYPPGNSVWDRTTEERLRLIAQGLADNDEIHWKLPGLRTLLTDYVDPRVDITSADFHRRLLRVFRDSDYDSAYQDNLEKLSPDEKERIERFVAEDKSLDDVSRDFDMCMSLGVREHLQHLIGVDCAHVSSAGVQMFTAPPEGGAAQPPVETQVEGLSGRSHFDWVKDRDTVFHSFLHELKELFTGHLAEHKVVVSENHPTSYTTVTDSRRFTRTSSSKTGAAASSTSRSTRASRTRLPASSGSSTTPKSTT
jgi:hypothetical protein